MTALAPPSGRPDSTCGASCEVCGPGGSCVPGSLGDLPTPGPGGVFPPSTSANPECFCSSSTGFAWQVDYAAAGAATLDGTDYPWLSSSRSASGGSAPGVAATMKQKGTFTATLSFSSGQGPAPKCVRVKIQSSSAAGAFGGYDDAGADNGLGAPPGFTHSAPPGADGRCASEGFIQRDLPVGGDGKAMFACSVMAFAKGQSEVSASVYFQVTPL